MSAESEYLNSVASFLAGARQEEQWSFTALLFLIGAATRGPIPIGLLGNMAGVDPAGLTAVRDSLVAKGYVTQQRGAADRRVILVEATDKGRAVLRKHAKAALRQLREVAA